MRKKIIFWKNELSEKEGHGRPLKASLADAWVKYGNDTYPHIIHMVVDADIPKIREPEGGGV